MDTVITIYVRRRWITRKGKRVKGWQAGFSRRGCGVTSEKRDDAIQHMRDVVLRNLTSAPARIEVVEVNGGRG